MNKLVIAIAAVIVAAGAGYYFGFDHGWDKSVDMVTNNNSSETPSGNDAEDAFHKDSSGNFYGTLTLTGYLDVQTRICNPGDMCGQTVEYASFVFSQTSSEAIKEFTGQQQGNSYVAGDRVGVGCVQETAGRIVYQNYGDENKIEGEIKGEDFTKLMSSSANNQVQLKLTRPLYTSGQGAPDCYSHFRNFDVL